MRYVSVFSGIEAASVAWMPLGWEPVAFCESAAFPASVLMHRLPGVPNFGDVREVAWRELRGVADVVVGGSPCQSFSVAGRREGLGGESGLMWEYVRCVRGVRPRWLVWENVPGVLSCARGEDFRRLLSALAKLGYGLAWRVLDAQYFGVPQRRRRVYLVGRLGDPESPAKVLLEPSCMQGNPAKGEGVGEADSRGTGGGPGDGVEVYAAQPREGTETHTKRRGLAPQGHAVYAAQPREGTETFPILSGSRHTVTPVYAAQPREGTETMLEKWSLYPVTSRQVYAAQPREGTETHSG